MRSNLLKSLILMIIVLGSIVLPYPYRALSSTNITDSKENTVLLNDTLLHTLKSVQSNISDTDSVFLRFANKQDLEEALIVFQELDVQILYRYQLLPLILVGKLDPEILMPLTKRCSILSVHQNREHQYITPPEELVSSSLDEALNSSRIHDIIGTHELLESGHDGSGIIIAILDTGVDGTHPDLEDKIVQEKSFIKTELGYISDEDPDDFLGHGTGVAGTAAGTGKASNGLYMGIAPGARLWNVKVLNAFGGGRDAGIIAGIDYATLGPNNRRDSSDPDVINLSLGGFGGPDELTSLAVDAAVSEGVVVSVSAGNEGPFYTSIGAPGAALYAITVGATKLNGELSKFSSRGYNLGGSPDPDIVAPGQNIISPLSAESFLGQSKTIVSPSKYIRGSGGNYVSLSGTSLSSPVVAGTCALLLEAFPILNEIGPIALRIALMSTANKTYYINNSNPNLVGAGILDVAHAVDFLENLTNSPDKDIILGFPHILFTEPAFIAFPGNRFTQNILLLTTSPGVYTFEAVGSIEPFIEIGESSINIDKADVVTINLAVSLPLDINPEIYGHIDGHVNIKKNDKIITSLSISPIEVQYPKLRVYFDNFHNQGPIDTPSSNFFAFSRLLRNNSIDIIFQNSFISYELLSSFDILMLPDVELVFSQEEIQAIQLFLEHGGDLIILGSEKRSTAAESVNALLKPYGIILANTIENATDQGLWLHHENDLNVTTFSTPHSLTQNVTALTWKSGVGLEVDVTNSNTKSLASILFEDIEHTILAVYDDTTSKQGKVIVLGTDFLFYDDLLNETGSSNQQLADNMFEFLIPDNDLIPSIRINSTHYAPGDVVDILTYTINSDNLQPTRMSDLVLIMTLPNGTETILTADYAKSPFEIIPGIYHYIYTLPPDLHGLFTFEVSSSQFDEKISIVISVMEAKPTIQSVEVDIKPGGLEINIPSWAIYFDTPQLDRYDDKITFEATITNVDQVILYLTRLGDELNDISTKITENYIFQMHFEPDQQHWTYEWNPDPTIPAGMYSYYVFPTNSDGFAPLSALNATGTFILLDSEPIIDESATSLNGRSILELNDLLDDERIISMDSSDVQIEIVGDDIEDNIDDLEAWVIVTEINLLVIDDYILSALKVPYNPQSQKFEMELTIQSDMFITPHGTLPDDSILMFIFIIRDSDGEYGEVNAISALQSGIFQPIEQILDYTIDLGWIMMSGLFYFHPLLGVTVLVVASFLFWSLYLRQNRTI